MFKGGIRISNPLDYKEMVFNHLKKSKKDFTSYELQKELVLFSWEVSQAIQTLKRRNLINRRIIKEKELHRTNYNQKNSYVYKIKEVKK